MKVTVFVPFSRPNRVKEMVDNLLNLDISGVSVDFVFVIDNKEISNDLFYILEDSIGNVKTHYTKLPLVHAANVPQRRKRIAEVFNIGRTLIPDDSDFVLCIEDDTDFPVDTLQRLIKSYNELVKAYSNVGFVTGVQAGRWASKMIGIWKADNVMDPSYLYTLELGSGVRMIDASGLYCMFIPSQLFIETQFFAKDFGPDVHFGLSLRKRGYLNFVDWNVLTNHVTLEGIIKVDNECESIHYRKQNGQWNKTKN